jgi:hypothetical protein
LRASGTRGYDAGKKINGRKRFIVTDTLGLPLVVVVLAASVQDRDGAKSVLLDTYLRTPVRFVFADGGFARRLLDWAGQILRTTVHIVRKPAGPAGLRGDPAAVGGGADVRLVDRAPPPGPRLRTRPGHFRSHDPLGGDQHHHPSYRPGRPGHPPTTPHIPNHQMIFSNTFLASIRR